jgi:hypothetical protein
MTIAAGFRCLDGVLIGTDTLVTDGVSKLKENKIFDLTPFGNCPTVLMAGSGNFAAIKDFADRLISRRIFDDLESTDDIKREVRNALQWEWYKDVVKQENEAGARLDILFAVKDWEGNTSLLHACGSDLSPVPEYYCIGAGAPIASYLSSWLYGLAPIEMMARLALWIFRETKQHTDGCGGDTKIRWLYGGFDDLDTQAISIDEDELPDFYSDLKPLIYGCLNRQVPDQMFASHLARFTEVLTKRRSDFLKS